MEVENIENEKSWIEIIKTEDAIISLAQDQIRFRLILLERLTRQDKVRATYDDRFQPNPEFFNRNQDNLPYRAEGHYANMVTKTLCTKWRHIFKRLFDQIETKFWTTELEGDFDDELNEWIMWCQKFEWKANWMPEKHKKNLETLEEMYVKMGHRLLELNDKLTAKWLEKHYAIGHFKRGMFPEREREIRGQWATEEKWDPTPQIGIEFRIVNSQLWIVYHDGQREKNMLCFPKLNEEGEMNYDLIDWPLAIKLETSLERFERIKPHPEPKWTKRKLKELKRDKS